MRLLSARSSIPQGVSEPAECPQDACYLNKHSTDGEGTFLIIKESVQLCCGCTAGMTIFLHLADIAVSRAHPQSEQRVLAG